MRQEDYILREIQRIGEFLLALAGKLHKKQTAQQILSEGLNEILPCNPEDFMKIPYEQLADVLVYEKGFNAENLEKLADVLRASSLEAYQKRALDLYILSEHTDRTFSMNRDLKIRELKASIKG